MIRPNRDEYAPYYEKYTSLVAEGDIVNTLGQQLGTTLALLETIDETRAGARYAPDKWSIKEVVGHLIDAERVFADRALRFARGDQNPQPGFDQDEYVRNGDFDARRLADLAGEFESVRRANLAFFKSLSEEAWSRRGVANDAPVSVRGLAHIIAGHELHHVQVLKTRYLDE